MLRSLSVVVKYNTKGSMATSGHCIYKENAGKTLAIS